MCIKATPKTLSTGGGTDTEGGTYSSPEELWAAELQPAEVAGEKPAFYSKAIDYWEKVPASVDGVLGVRLSTKSYNHQKNYLGIYKVIL